MNASPLARKLRSVSDAQDPTPSRAQFLISLRKTFLLPDSRVSVLNTLPCEEYESYLMDQNTRARFSLKRHIATGAQASVQLMEESASGREYAVKITFLDDAETVRLAVKEFTVLQQLNHPNIVKPAHFYIDQVTNKALLFMPLITEATLSSLIISKTILSEATVQKIGNQLFSCLAYLHSQGVAHRDINPTNVLHLDGHITLIDFQTASILHASQWMMSFAGTKDYIAPEVYTKSVYTAKVDVWSGAAILLRLLGFTTRAELQDVSPECREWMSLTLEDDPDRRLSAEEAGRHAWPLL